MVGGTFAEPFFDISYSMIIQNDALRLAVFNLCRS